MCGILFIFGNEHISREYTQCQLPLLKSLESRGPDKTVIFSNDKTLAAHARLSIVGIEVMGDQPFTNIYYDEELNRNVQCTLIVNGEIYNFKDLIIEHQLENLKSYSDCEVIIALWKKYKDINKIIKLIRGEFAFVLHIEYLKTHDKEFEHCIYVCRDPFGIRPLFWNMNDGYYFFGSILKSVGKGGRVFTPGRCIKINNIGAIMETTIDDYYIYPQIQNAVEKNIKNIYKNITDKFINAVKIRLMSDVPIGITLSGGLDSSIVAGVAVLLGVKNLHTFTTGLPGSVDIANAEICAKHLKTIHVSVPKTSDIACSWITDAIKMLETWDITTIRASIWQIIISHYISMETDIKVILNGDGSDELLMGYKENYLAPNKVEAFDNVTYRLKNIHKYDGLRMDRSVASHGLEARPPFLDVDFVDYVRTIDPELLMPIKGERMEKNIFRQAFKTLYPDIIPDEILLRPKEAFSDGVSTINSDKSWFNIIQEYIDLIVPDIEYNNRHNRFASCHSKEAYYYKRIFYDNFGDNFDVIGEYWLPKWSNTLEPSARTLLI